MSSALKTPDVLNSWVHTGYSAGKVNGKKFKKQVCGFF